MSSRRLAIAIALGVLVLASTAIPAAASAPLPGERIAAGVTAAGVDVSGLTVDEASQKLEAAYGERMKKGVSVVGAGRRFRLTAAQAGVAFDPLTSAKRALYAGRQLALSPPAPGAPPAGVDIPLAIGVAEHAVRVFAGRVDRGLSRSPRNSTLRITLRSVKVTHSRKGRDIDQRQLAHYILASLADPRLGRLFRPKLVQTTPKVTAQQVRRTAGTVITIEQSTFTLRLFKGTRLRKSYTVAVGQPAYPTPRGRFSIVSKQVNPVWSVPNSPWAGELGGTTVVGGSAANPLKARWMGIVNGVGIHGTGEDASIGSRASHGCIRMHVWDVIALYNQVPVGTPVLIG